MRFASLGSGSEGNGLLDEAKVRQAVQTVISATPRGYVPILSHFQRLVKLAFSERRNSALMRAASSGYSKGLTR